MKRHILSFLRSPLGYIFNLLATVNQYIPLPRFAEDLITNGCEFFCPKDDSLQQDPLF